ncbi:MAG TPA: hypothetical protein VH744_00470 [Terriglobales bacterium]
MPAMLAGAVLVAALIFAVRYRKPITLSGAVTMRDTDPRKELPIADVEIVAATNLEKITTKSDASGGFRMTLPVRIRRGREVTFQFRHPRFRPLVLKDIVGDKLYIARMEPLAPQKRAESRQRQVSVANIRVRYAIKAMTAANIGSTAENFQVINKGNVPCKGQNPCSPDGKWKAAIGSTSLDAGPGNEFRNARVSCIAGPCPFTRIESDDFSLGGQKISVSARSWSDTTTFLLEAEVFHPMVSEIVHYSHPVTYGRALNFTLPASSEGVSIQADIDQTTIIFPLGPALLLSWASCNARVNPDQTKVYRCELKPGYAFQ